MRRSPLFSAFPCAVLCLLTCGQASADLNFTVEGRPYRLVTNEANYANAQAAAVTAGGQLVHIDSAAENAAIFAAISAAVPSGSTSSDGGNAKYVWIGGTESPEGTYAWVDQPSKPFWTGGRTGAAANGLYANWGRAGTSQEPDNSGSNQNRAAMGITAWPASGTNKIGQPGEWNDIRESNTLAYIIEFDGIWASFRMSHGSVAKGIFTAKLFHDKVPLTVGNFVGLAQGTQTFVDEKNGTVAMRPYFNGLKCHRIIRGFMIQGGCPRGNGSSGPGYQFPDEFDATLRHTAAGKLSMANSGVDTNGSQFFVTVAPTTHLDEKHSIFGEVVDGYSTVVQPLSEVLTVNPAAQDDRPLQDVIMEEITIHRAGTTARALAPALPVLDLVPLTVTPAAGAQCMLDFVRTPFAGYDLLLTGNLTTWSMVTIGNFNQTPDLSLLNGTNFAPAGAPGQFFRMARINHPSPGAASLVGRKIVVESSSLRLTYNLSGPATATYNVFQAGSPPTNISGNITSWSWERSSWGGTLSAAIAAGEITIGLNQIRFLDAVLRPATNLGRGALYIADHNNFYSIPGVSRLTITALP